MKTIATLLAAGMLLAISVNAAAQSISTVQFSSARYTVDENAGAVVLTVDRIGEPGGMAYVEYIIRSGTATNGEDYVEQNCHLQFIGETNLTIVVPILNDGVAECDETFTVTLLITDPFDAQLGTITDAVVTIRDDDGREATRHVNVASLNPVSPYTSWATAAITIQDAIDAAVPSDVIVVTNGIYATGGRVAAGSLTNRVSITKPLTVRSVNGSAVTRVLNNCLLIGNSARFGGGAATLGGAEGIPLE